MEKINKPLSKQFPSVILYLNDLVEIIGVLRNENFKKIDIITPTHKYNDTELAKIPIATPIIEIKSYGVFYISINFNNSFGDGVRIYTDTDSSLAEGVMQKIEKILIARKRKIFSLTAKTGLVIVVFFIIQILAYFFNAKSIINEFTKNLIILVAFIFYIFSIVIDSGKLFRKNYFYYKNREDQPGFWDRNKDQILIKLMIIIITAIISVLSRFI